MIRRFASALALGVVVAAIVAPAALAKPVSSDVANGGYDPWAYGLIYKSTHQSTTPGPLAPWERNFTRSMAYTHPTPVKPVNLGPLDPFAYALVHKAQSTPVVTTSSTSSSGFDYSDAGIGAGVAFGIALILVGMIVVGMRYRRIDRSGLATS